MGRARPHGRVEVSMDASDGFLAVLVAERPGLLVGLARRLKSVLWRRYGIRYRVIHMRELEHPEKGRILRTFIELAGPEEAVSMKCLAIGRGAERLREAAGAIIRALLARRTILAIYADLELAPLIARVAPGCPVRPGEPVELADILAWLNLAYRRGDPLVRFRRAEDFIRRILKEPRT